jgi:hypothetical protein
MKDREREVHAIWPEYLGVRRERVARQSVTLAAAPRLPARRRAREETIAGRSKTITAQLTAMGN